MTSTGGSSSPRPTTCGFSVTRNASSAAAASKPGKPSKRPSWPNSSNCWCPLRKCCIFRPFLLDERPRFVDFDLYGILGNFLHSGHYRLPAAHDRLRQWHRRMSGVQLKSFAREKELHP